jgi:hypothetical protein
MKTFKQLLTEGRGDNHLATELFHKCRQAATFSHYQHLMTESYAQHMALGAFYDGIIPLLDSFLETYIGLFGKLETVQENIQVPFKVSVYELKEWIETNRQQISDSTTLQNILDTIVELCSSTIYKLENLK